MNTIDSIKQHLMMKAESWNSSSISDHYESMKTVLLGELGSEGHSPSI